MSTVIRRMGDKSKEISSWCRGWSKGMRSREAKKLFIDRVIGKNNRTWQNLIAHCLKFNCKPNKGKNHKELVALLIKHFYITHKRHESVIISNYTFKLTKVDLHIHVLQFRVHQGSYDVVETMNIVGINLLSLIPYLITSGKSLKLWLEVGSKSELEDIAQWSINLLPTGLFWGRNILHLSGQVIGMTLALKPKLNNGGPCAVIGYPS